MAMDVFERLNRRFGSWYEGLFGGTQSGDLRPRDVLRRILAAMEDARREGLDGNIYVPNVFTLRVQVSTDEERDYLRTFLNADELAAAVRQTIEQHGYRLRGGLLFTVEEVSGPPVHSIAGRTPDRVTVLCRFDAASAPAQYAAQEISGLAAMPARPSGEIGFARGDAAAMATIPAAPLATLTIYSAEGATRDVFPLTAKGARIGRAHELGNDIVLDDGMVSKKHARIAFENNGFVLHDDGSTNGTYVCDSPVLSGAGVLLRSGDEIRVGETRLRFAQSSGKTNADSLPTIPAPKTTPPPAEDWDAVNTDTRADWGRLGGGASQSASAYRLLGESGEVYPLASEMTVGRSLTGDITVIGAGVSTQHARLTIRGGALYVEDLSTPGGTFVNGERIPANFAVVLYDGDQIAFGEVALRVQRFSVGQG